MKDRDRLATPIASRPFMPGYGIVDANSGGGLLPWEWAVEHLTKSRNYWIATTTDFISAVVSGRARRAIWR